jgi:hypothetical protein
MLQLMAGISLLLFITHALYVYDIGFIFFLWGYLIIGLLGLFSEFYLKKIRPWVALGSKMATVKAGLSSRDTWMACAIVSLSMAMIYSAIWPSGRMEGWVNTGADFYYWIFMATKQLGLIDPDNSRIFGIFPFFEFDGLGTQVLLSFISMARAQLPYEAAPAIVVTLLVWFGTAVYELVRQVFKLSFFQTVFICVALCFSSLLNYISIFGMFGHLFALTIFIVSLTQIFSNDTFIHSYKLYVKKLFFPLFALFLSYQAGYVLYSSYIILSLFLLTFFSSNISLLKKSLKSLGLALGTIFLVSLVCAILMPGLAHHLLERNVQITHQQAGWPIPLINPLLFSGLPFFLSPEQFHYTQVAPVSIYTYCPFILIILVLTYICYRSKTKFCTYNNIIFNNILVLVSIYIISILFYLSIFLIFGNIYRIWKYSAYTILPLSFLNLSLLLFLISNLKKNKILLFKNILPVVLIIFYASKIFNYNYIISIAPNYFKIQPNYFLLSAIYDLKRQYNKYNFIFNFSDYSLIFISSMALSKSSNNLYFYPGIYFIYSSLSHINKINTNSLFISNVNYPDLINGINFPYKQTFLPFNIYNYSSILDKGYVQITSNRNIFLWKITNYPVNYKFIVPSKIINKDIIFSLTLNPEHKLDPMCNELEFGLYDDNREIIWTKKNINDLNGLNFLIPAASSATGRLDIFTRVPFRKGQPCVLYLNKVDLSTADTPAL